VLSWALATSEVHRAAARNKWVRRVITVGCEGKVVR
jgi:hypothetical protein